MGQTALIEYNILIPAYANNGIVVSNQTITIPLNLVITVSQEQLANNINTIYYLGF